MVNVVKMPRMGAVMKQGKVTKWLVEEGDHVEEGDELYEVATEKLSNTIESEYDGIVRKFLVDEDVFVPCQTPLCIIADEDDDISEYL